MPMFQRAGMKKGGLPVPPTFEHLILMIWKACDLNLVLWYLHWLQNSKSLNLEWLFFSRFMKWNWRLFENCRRLERRCTIVRWRDRKKANVLGFSVARSHCLTLHCPEVRFASFLSGGFITAKLVVNPLKRKLAKRTSVHCTVVQTL